MESGPGFFLDVLCLTLCCDDLETEKIITNVLNTYHDEVQSGSSLNDETTKFYVKLITELTKDDIDLNNPGEVEALLLRFDQHPAIKQNPKILKRIESIVNNTCNIYSTICT